MEGILHFSKISTQGRNILYNIGAQRVIGDQQHFQDSM